MRRTFLRGVVGCRGGRVEHATRPCGGGRTGAVVGLGAGEPRVRRNGEDLGKTYPPSNNGLLIPTMASFSKNYGSGQWPPEIITTFLQKQQVVSCLWGEYTK